MFGANALIAGGAVLQVVAVAVGLELIPLDGHLRCVDSVVILGVEVIGIILFANGLHVAPEYVEWLHMAVGVCQSKHDLGE